MIPNTGCLKHQGGNKEFTGAIAEKTGDCVS